MDILVINNCILEIIFKFLVIFLCLLSSKVYASFYHHFQIAFQHESLPWYKGQMNKKEVEATLDESNKTGVYLAYKKEDDLFLGIKSNDDVIHLPIKQTPCGGFLAKYGNSEAISRDSLIDIIEHFQISPLNLGDGTAEVVLSEPFV